MSSMPKNYKELVRSAADHLQGMLLPGDEADAKRIQKGLLLYRQGLIIKAKFENESITAIVQDVTRAHVSIDLNYLQLSSCSCPSDGLCRHQIAVFFYAYAQVGSVSEWIDEFRTPINEKKATLTWGVQRAKDLLKTTGVITSPTYEGWINSFETSFQEILNAQSHPRPYIVNELYQVYSRKLRAAAPIEQEWKQLYLLIASIHSFRHLLYFSKTHQFDAKMINQYYRHIFQQLTDDIIDLVERINIHALPLAFDDFIEKLRTDSLFLIINDTDLEIERIQLYMILWTKLFKKKDWRLAEIERLQQHLTEELSFPATIAVIHQHILLTNDAEAISLIHTMKKRATLFIIFWLEILLEQKEWARMEQFVDVLIGVLKPYMNDLNDDYARVHFSRWTLQVLAQYAHHQRKFDQYERALIQLLPFSFQRYDEFLFERKSYEKWGELQAFVGIEVTSIPSYKIKMIQTETPKVLLPLYHQAISHHLQLKNRSHYREAVKLLKKLRTLYKKLKRQDDWEYFFEQLLEKTKRQKAFHQECERGKLIDAKNLLLKN